MVDKVIVRMVGFLFILGGIAHWLIIFGVMQEYAPTFVSWYFHSLAILSPLTGMGLCLRKEWGRKLGMLIAVTQIPAHLYMLFLDRFLGWESQVSSGERMLDLAFAAGYMLFFRRPSIRALFTYTRSHSAR